MLKPHLWLGWGQFTSDLNLFIVKPTFKILNDLKKKIKDLFTRENSHQNFQEQFSFNVVYSEETEFDRLEVNDSSYSSLSTMEITQSISDENLAENIEKSIVSNSILKYSNSKLFLLNK